MNPILVVAADMLVAILLVATIATSVRLSRRFAGLKADEAAMRTTVAELAGATASAERAIVGLRATLDECDATLRSRVADAARSRGDLDRSVARAEEAMASVGRIADTVQRAARPVPAAPVPPSGDAPAPGPGSRPAGDPLKAALRNARDIADRAARRAESRAA